MPDQNGLDPTLASWLAGGSAGPQGAPAAASPGLSPSAGGGLDSDLAGWLSGDGQAAAPSTAPAAPGPAAHESGAPTSALSFFGQALGLLDRPRNALFVAGKHAMDTWQSAHPEAAQKFTGVFAPLQGAFAALSPSAWKAGAEGFGKGITGEETYHGVDAIRDSYPEFAAQHPKLTAIAGGITDIAGDPLVFGGSAGAKAAGVGLETAGRAAFAGAPELYDVAKASAGPLFALAKTTKPAIAAQSVARNVAGMFSIDKALAHLPQGKAAVQAIREFLGGKQLGQAANAKNLEGLFSALKDATPEEKATLAHILDSPTAAEAEAKAARVAEQQAAAAKKAAALDYQAPAPWDDPAVAPQIDLARRGAASLPGPEFDAVRAAAEGAGQTPEQFIQDVGHKVYGLSPGGSLSPTQRDQVVRAFSGAQNLEEGTANLLDILRNEGVAGPGEFGAAVKGKSAMSGIDPFDMTPAQRVQSLSDQLAETQRMHDWELAKHADNVKRLARSAAQDLNAANSSARSALWQEIMNIGKIRPGSGTAGAEMTKGLPSFLKDLRNGMGLDEIASSMRGGMTEQQLVDEIQHMSGLHPVRAADTEAQRIAEQMYLATPEGRAGLETRSAYRQQMQDLQEALDAAKQELNASRAPFDDMPGGEFPRPSWTATPEVPPEAEDAYLAAERGGMSQGGGEEAANAAASGQGGRYAGVPEHLQHLIDPVMQKYGALIPQFRALTDEAYAKARGFLPNLGYQEFYYPRISRAGSEGDNALQKLYQRLTSDDRIVPTKPDQLAGALSGRPGFSKERTLDTLADYAEYAGTKGRHAVLDPADALLQHMDQATHAEQSMALRDKLLGMGDGVALKADKLRDIPPGYMDMSHVPGWERVAVQKDIGRVLQDVLLPKARGPAGVLYDTAANAIKGATFYNPFVHGKNLAYRAFGEGMNPLAGLAKDVQAEVSDLGPAMQNLIRHGAATEYRPMGEAAARELYQEARLKGGTATTWERFKAGLDKLHESLWQYDKGLRVAMAQQLEQQGMPWPEIAQRVNQAFSKPLDQTFANMWVKRLMFTPAWTFNNLAWDARNVLNPRVRALTDLLEGINVANTGHGREENPGNKEEYTALGKPGGDNKALFVNFNTPDKDLREVARNPLDFLWQRLAPIPQTVGGLALGNSRPLDAERGLDYNAPGAGGPLIGYGSNGMGPDVGLRTQAVARQLPPLLGFPFGSVVSEAGNAARSDSPLRDFALRLGGVYASDFNERRSQGLDTKQAIKDRRSGLRARAIRQYRRENPQE